MRMVSLSVRFLTALLVAGSTGMICEGSSVVARAEAGCVIYVDDSATSGANTGQSWQDAYTTLQAALSAAASFDGCEICVAQGV